jgi:hypothetical protein
MKQLGEFASKDPLYLALSHPNSPNYVYRCLGRTNSESDPTANIHSTGYDKPNSIDNTEDDSFWYGIGKAWFLKLWPRTNDYKSYILIYKNDPHTFPQDREILDPKLLKRESSSLRDLLIGIVRIDWR